MHPRFSAFTRVAALVAAFAALAPGVASASGPAGYPGRPVTIVVPFAPGGATDIIGRLVADELAKRWKSSVVVENRAGAGGAIGTDQVAKARGDGHTLLLGTQTALSVYPTLMKRIPYNVRTEFAPVTLLASTPLVLLASHQSGAQTTGELIAAIKARPATVPYGSSGVGTSQHLTTELFLSRVGAKAIHVPYKGSSQSLTDLAGGQIAMQFDNMATALAFARGGKARALAVTSATRSELAPELPTIAESGAPGFEAQTWLGLLAPAGTPREIVSYLSTEVAAALSSPDVKAKLAAQGFTVRTNTPDEFSRYIAEETAKFAAVIRENNLTLE